MLDIESFIKGVIYAYFNGNLFNVKVHVKQENEKNANFKILIEITKTQGRGVFYEFVVDESVTSDLNVFYTEIINIIYE